MKARTLVLTMALLSVGLDALAATQPLSDDELSDVAGREGVALALDLDLNAARLAGGGQATDARLLVGYRVGGQTTYAVLQDIGGQMTLAAMAISVRKRVDGGGDYVDIALPGFVGFANFGFRAMGAISNPDQALGLSNSLGGLQLNGTGSMTGHVYVWAQ